MDQWTYTSQKRALTRERKRLREQGQWQSNDGDLLEQAATSSVDARLIAGQAQGGSDSGPCAYPRAFDGGGASVELLNGATWFAGAASFTACPAAAAASTAAAATASAAAYDEDIAERFHRIIRSFRDPRTREFIECYFGNSAINTTELNHMLPIYNYDI